MDSKEHWEKQYTTRPATEVSWYQEHAGLALKFITGAGVSHSASIIDAGGGASTLVDDLLIKGYSDITVLDLSGAALAKARARLGAHAEKVKWLEADVLTAALPAHGYDIWHDRAVFHFLTAAGDRRAYVSMVRHAVKPGGLIIIATFAEDGPARCSGLPVMRYSAAGLYEQLGEGFELLRHERETHRTPGGGEQNFVYCLFSKSAI